MVSTRAELRQLLDDVAEAAGELREREHGDRALPYAKLHWLAVGARELFSYPEIETLDLPREMEVDALTSAVILRHGLRNRWPVDDYFDAARKLGRILATITSRPGQVSTSGAPYYSSLFDEFGGGGGGASPYVSDVGSLPGVLVAAPDEYAAEVSALPGRPTTGDED
jgi:hypothetical protein